MVRDRMKDQTRAQIQRLGVPITVTDYEAVEEDEYGTEPQKTARSPYQIPAVPVSPSEEMFETITGDDISYSMAFQVKDEDATDISDKEPTEALRSEIKYQGETWDVNTKQQYYTDGIVILGVTD